jgi:hypothetical protein
MTREHVSRLSNSSQLCAHSARLCDNRPVHNLLLGDAVFPLDKITRFCDTVQVDRLVDRVASSLNTGGDTMCKPERTSRFSPDYKSCQEEEYSRARNAVAESRHEIDGMALFAAEAVLRFVERKYLTPFTPEVQS